MMYDDPWRDARQAIEGCEQFVAAYSGSMDERENLRMILVNASGMEAQLRSAGTPMATELANRCSSLQSRIRGLL